jgi:hypothetical protein
MLTRVVERTFARRGKSCTPESRMLILESSNAREVRSVDTQDGRALVEDILS